MLTKDEQKTLKLARKAVEYAQNGDPMRDTINEDQMRDALELLVKLADMTDSPGRRD